MSSEEGAEAEWVDSLFSYPDRTAWNGGLTL